MLHFAASSSEGQGPLKELEIEELFSTLDQACLLETLHLDIAFQMTQTLLHHHKCLCQFMDHDVANTGTQLSALCFYNSDLSKSSETAANDSDIEVTKATPQG
ncbi:hypothetical protein H0H87_000518 [Tephrocybe sp. NHM501043]|nr:hypothetical protein H0H87_000518 [Tephrocybe sp. NHM501043]